MIKHTMEIEATGCLDCPFCRDLEFHGQIGTVCSHPEFKEEDDRVVIMPDESFQGTPKWCPFKLPFLCEEQCDGVDLGSDLCRKCTQ